MLLAVWLRRDALLQKPVLVQLEEDALDDLGMRFGGGPAEVVELDIEPVVDGPMLGMEFVTELCLEIAMCQSCLARKGIRSG